MIKKTAENFKNGYDAEKNILSKLSSPPLVAATLSAIEEAIIASDSEHTEISK